MAEMRAATGADDLRALHAQAAVAAVAHGAGRQRLVEAGPAGATMELGPGVVQRMSAHGAHEGAITFVVRVFPGESPFGAAIEGDVVEIRRKDLFPFTFRHVQRGGVGRAPIWVVRMVTDFALRGGRSMVF